jgi:hypothetical protein
VIRYLVKDSVEQVSYKHPQRNGDDPFHETEDGRSKSEVISNARSNLLLAASTTLPKISQPTRQCAWM